MPETVDFNTFLVIVIVEFCIMAAVLGLVIGRAIDRAFKYLIVKTKLNEELEELENVLREFRDGWGHDEQAHAENKTCRRCAATKVLGERALRDLKTGNSPFTS